MRKILRLPVLALVQLLSLWSQPLEADPLDHWHLRYDGSDWVQQGDQTLIHGIVYGNGRFVGVRFVDGLASPNGTEWFSSGYPVDMYPVHSITFANDMFIAFGQA